jgi:phosphonate transport system permease protein
VQREVVGATLYTFDRNVRMAAVLGIVGAGGIGVPLKEAVDLFRYSDALAILIVILVALLVIEFLSDSLRRRLN